MTTKRAAKTVSKIQTENLRDYELVVVLNPELADEKLDAAVDNINRFITERGGSVSEVDKWGKRRLAYPIKHFLEGSYVLYRFKARPALGKDLSANLEITENVVRHLLMKLSA